jgi:hypothetical protein
MGSLGLGWKIIGQNEVLSKLTKDKIPIECAKIVMSGGAIFNKSAIIAKKEIALESGLLVENKMPRLDAIAENRAEMKRELGEPTAHPLLPPSFRSLFTKHRLTRRIISL